MKKINGIIQLGEPILQTKTSQITDFKSNETLKIINALLKKVGELKEKSVGLAAPQIGYSKAICVVKDNQSKKYKVLINPKILTKSKANSVYWEGCLSVDGIFAPIERSKKVTIKYNDRNGNEKEMPANNFFAHVVQHEIDHLNGILFLKHVKNPQNIWKNDDLDEYLEKHNDYPEMV